MEKSRYFERFAVAPAQIEAAPDADLGLSVVIPCFDEPDLLSALGALRNCTPPRCGVEVITVINSSESAPPAVRARNEATFRAAEAWAASNQDSRCRFHVLHCPDLPVKHAGVGLARKIGMDEAARRFDALHRDGIIACFDADCRCDENYITAMEEHFLVHRQSAGASIYFEHPLEGPFALEVYEAILRYELHLRYYVQALRYAGAPYACQTVGSAMAVRASAYKALGGMNKRQAGEDFYFLQKVASMGTVTDLTSTRVVPSPRPSERVPFGTGRAVRQFLESGKFETYPLQAILELRKFFAVVPVLHAGASNPWENIQSSVLQRFLQEQGFGDALEEIRANTASPESFRQRFFAWFNAFRAMKYLNQAREAYGPGQVEVEAGSLLELLDRAEGAQRSARELLGAFRALAKLGR